MNYYLKTELVKNYNVLYECFIIHYGKYIE
jgi:hypothetical protein